jgi:hypothetical protein
MNSNIYNNSGAVTDLFNILKEKSIYGLNSLDEIFDYKRNYKIKIEEIKKEQELLINDEIIKLNSYLNEPKKNIFYKIKSIFIKRKLNYYTNNFEIVISEKSQPFINKIEYTISVLNNLSPLIYGCVGEIKAINLFKNLPEQYYVINDFRERFNPPIYNRNENDKIFSIQLDHIIIGPTGVYLIETKYWNQKSIENNQLFSPVKQLKRGSYALFIIINDCVKNKKLFSNNWGTIKISVFSILLMMNAITNEQFQYVKVLNESNLVNYIIKRPIIFNEDQIKYIVNQLRK